MKRQPFALPYAGIHKEADLSGNYASAAPVEPAVGDYIADALGGLGVPREQALALGSAFGLVPQWSRDSGRAMALPFFEPTAGNIAGAGVEAALMAVPGAKGVFGLPAVKGTHDIWKALKAHDNSLTGDFARAIDEWVGGAANSLDKGMAGGLMMPQRLESMDPAAWSDVARPVRDALRQRYGDAIPVYRGEAPGAGQSTGRQNRYASYTTDRAVAERFAGAGPEVPTIGEDEIEAAEKALAATGEAKVGRHTFRAEPEGGIGIYDRSDNFVTDTADIRSVIDSDNAWAAEKNAERAKALEGVREYSIPVDDVLWATDRFGQREIIGPAMGQRVKKGVRALGQNEPEVY
jgi:hypothetical protein